MFRKTMFRKTRTTQNMQVPTHHLSSAPSIDAYLNGGKEHNSITGEQNVNQPKEENKALILKLQLIKSWDTVLMISWVIGVLCDPLFFYIPIVNEENKCLGVDTNIRVCALVLRGLADFTLILNIVCMITTVIGNVKSRIESINKNPNVKSKPESKVWFMLEVARNMPWFLIIVHILALLPIPQVLMSIFFNMKSSRYLGRRKIIDFFLLIQYIPRVFLMHQSSERLRHNSGVWIRGALYFFLYILASHVLGAFWYFFSIQRETSCWHQACMTHGTSECNFYCNQDMTSRNMTFVNSLDEFCLVDVPANATSPFDFGIFLDSLKSGNTAQINFGKKFAYSFWWGLRNLSNFGTNLDTTTYVMENLFAILISIIGLLLFLYLIGSVQTLISMEAEKTEERRRKLQQTEMDMLLWMKKHDLHSDTKTEINTFLKQKWEKIKDTDIENIFSILPPKNRLSLKRTLCMETLTSKVPLKLNDMNAVGKKLSQENKDSIKEKVLTLICDFLKPVIYSDGEFVYRMGEPLDRMLLINDGLIWTYNTTGISRTTSSDGISKNEEGNNNGSCSKCLGKGDVYGDELMKWASDSLGSLDNLPMIDKNAKAHGKVEGFVLMARDLKVVVKRYQVFWPFPDNGLRSNAAAQAIQKAFQNNKMLAKKDQPKALSSAEATVVDIPPKLTSLGPS